MAAREVTQGRRQREGEQEVRNWQQQLLLAHQPGLSSMLLASWTVAILAGVVAVAGGATGRTGIDVPAHRFSATPFNRSHRRAMTGQQPLTKLRPVGRPIL